MNLAQETDFTTLGWLKPELDVTLKEARQALERYAANPADMQAMRNCAARITRGSYQYYYLFTTFMGKMPQAAAHESCAHIFKRQRWPMKQFQ